MKNGNGKSKAQVSLDQEERIQRLLALFAQTPIIPTVRMPERLEAAVAAPGKLIYVVCGDLQNVEAMLNLVNEHGKTAVLNLDLMSGFARDRSAVVNLACRGARGIISTHTDVLREAQKLGLFAIQRTFMIDSGAVCTLLKNLAQLLPDALEVLPAIAAPKLILRMPTAYSSLPIVAGGLVDSMEEADGCFRKGVHAISASDERLWVV